MFGKMTAALLPDKFCYYYFVGLKNYLLSGSYYFSCLDYCPFSSFGMLEWWWVVLAVLVYLENSAWMIEKIMFQVRLKIDV